MNSSRNNREVSDTNVNSLHALSSLQPPDGMQERLAKSLAEHVRQQHRHPVARGFRKYAWELWTGASIAVVAAAVILCIFALQTHRAANPPLQANVTAHAVIPAPNLAAAVATTRSSVPAHAHHASRRAMDEPIPHTPPPMPLTSQERLLLALAETPSLAAGVAQSQTISQHGLGNNALFELDHEQLQPMRTESKLLQPLPPLPHNLP